MKRIVVQWSSPAVKGLAVSVLNFVDGTTDPSKVCMDAWTAAKGSMSTGMTVTVPASGDVLDNSTGRLTDVWTSPTGGGAVTGSTTAPAAAGVGACVTWLTTGIENGRRVRGRTFFVPLPAGAYESDGTLLAAQMTLLSAWAQNLGSGGLAVFHRPTSKGGSDGNLYPIERFVLRDRVAFLSSRRD